MTHFTFFHRRISVYFLRAFSLITACLCGIILGVQCFFSSQDQFISMMRRSVSCSVSIVGLLGSFIPLFICLVYSGSITICSAVFIKSYCYTVTVMSCFHAFGRGSWLVSVLLLFASHVSVFLLIWISLRHFIRQESFDTRFRISILSLTLLTACIELCIIQPYLAAVF